MTTYYNADTFAESEGAAETSSEDLYSFPLSFAQQRLWFLDQMEPGSDTFNLPLAVRMIGRLNVSALGQTLSEVVRRHEVLRTTFTEVEGRPAQIIHPARPFPLHVADLSSFEQSEREHEAERLAAEEAARPFDLAAGPVMRAQLLRLAEEEHVLLFTMHHIVSDGWSMGVLINEVSALYVAFAEGRPSPLEELPIQYADFAVWQREWLSGEELERQLSYWRRQLGGELPVLELPTDRPRPAVQTFRGGAETVVLSREVTARLKELSREHGATLFMTLLAAWQTLLHRYSGQDDIIVGTDIANRNRAETKNLIGFFVNQLVLRTDLSGDPTFVELLKRVKEVCLEAYAHQDVPFEKLVEELHPERSLSRSPLFQALFVLQNAPTGELELPGIKLQSFGSDTKTAKLDLIFMMSEGAYGFGGTLEYNSDLFDDATARRLLDHFRLLLDAIAADPHRPLSRLPLISPEERRLLLRDWNRTSAPYPAHLSVHQVFEERAAAAPDALALSDRGSHLSYRELNERANRLAHRLRSLGVGPEVPVGVCLERSAELVVALLGILKAGGAYVPLDPQYPLERLSFMLDDAALQVVLTERVLADRLPAHWGQTLALDEPEERALIAAQSVEDIPTAVCVENLAYVVYTSGSTGRPKGVCVTHRGVLRLVCGASYARLGAEQAVLHAAPVSFDASTFELWGALLNGGRCVLFDGAVPTASALREAIEREHVSTMWLTSSLFNSVVDEEAGALAGVGQLLVGGEALSARHVGKFLEECPGVELVNGYGPTENTTFTCCHAITKGDAARRSVPIGRPVGNTEVYILDARLEPVPVGVTGELYTSGAGLARGYLGHAALTAEKFLPHPHGAEPGGRLYRTGDLARYLEDGSIEFVGRADGQVKVRGHRIELGEIEAALADHAAVGECVVVAREDEGGNKRLVAYVVGEGPVSAAELREYLQGRVPEYMVPSAFVTLDALPLTPNGKVDRRALPAPEYRREDAGGLYVAPRTPIEAVLAGVFAQVLELEEVGIHDNFFELGGHSLLATQVVSRVRELFGVELALRSLFEAPTVAGLSESLARAEGGCEAPPVLPAPRDRALPLSFAQQRLWFLDQMEPGSTAYNIPLAVRLTGKLNTEALGQTLTEVVRRHEVLRTTFAARDGEPVQVIHPAHPVSLHIEDLSASEESEREARRLAAEEAARAFDLEAGPLLRARLLRLSDEEHVLLFTMHHIISDGWSLGVLVNEVGTLYEAFARGEESPLAELPIQYADFAVWQREWLQGEVLERQLSYWREQLGGELPVLELPTDKPRPAVQTFRGGADSMVLGREVSARLKELSREHGATLFMTLLAAWQTLLMRYSKQEEIVVGVDVANRNRGETEGLIGFFVNMLVLRTDLAGDPSFVELLGRVREVCLGAYAHQDVPFEKLVEELQPGRSLSHTPLFQVVFGFQNAPQGELKLPDLRVSHMGVSETAAKYDLNFSVRETEGRLSCGLDYNADLFEADTIGRMLTHFRLLLEGVVADPRQPLSALPLLSADERRRVIYEWNDTAAAYPDTACFHQLFEAQAERTPDATALVYGDERLTYGELNRRANRLAHYLRGAGVGPEVTVGLCVERSTEMAVWLLAVLKAGGAYLPLDPQYPRERLSFMLRDARVPVVLTRRELLDVLPPHDARVITPDADDAEIARASSANPRGGAHADSLAYVIYTSGSTGKPKGVMITHRAVVNHNFAVISSYGLCARDRVLQFASLSFDVAVEEMFPTWLSGGAVILRPDNLLDSHGAFFEFMERERVTVVNLSTPYWSELMAELARTGEALPRSLRLAAVGGEKAAPRQFAAWKRMMGEGARLMNVYGPTETTVTNTVYELTGVDAEREVQVLPLGRPIANTRLYVLDPRGQLLPVGIAGELHIGGESLARGYLGRPGQTALKFVPDSFSGVPGARLYKTGDLVRYLADGQVEFLGRADDQVKVRGFRIEPGEIEAALREHEAVREALVVVREEAAGDKRVVAYVVCRGDARPSPAELRGHMQERVPEYMVPQAFVLLETMPLTSNGKVDRRALPAPDFSQAVSGSDFVAPRTQIEELLANIWSEVLGVSRAGVHDDFFELGGHSLLATQVMSRLRAAFRVELPLRVVFEQPTIAGLAQSVAAALQSAEQTEAAPILPAARDRALPLSFAQQRLWFLDRLEPGSAAYNIPLAVRLGGHLNVGALEQTFSEIVRRHEALRTTFAEVDGKPVQIVRPAEPLKLSVEDLRALPEEGRETEARRLAAEEARRPYDLGRGPLLRVRVLRLGEAEHVVLLTMHHIVSDGWSMGVLIKEFGALYEAYAEGRPSPLAELPIQYADFAVWQREWLSGEVMGRQLAYWKKRLEGMPPALELPADRPHPAGRTYRGAAEPLVFPAALSEGLKRLSRSEGLTSFMTLLAVFKTMFYRHTKQEDIVIGADIANRNRAETESLIGYFQNLLVLRTELKGRLSFRELLRQVRETTLGAYAHQDVPFEKLVEELRHGRDLSRNPLVQVVLSWQDTASERLELPGLTLGAFDNGEVMSKWDLALFVWETERGIGGGWKYNPDIFDAATVRRLSGHFLTLLASAVADPETRLDKLEMVTEDERAEQQSEKRKLKQAKLSKFKKVAPRPDRLRQEELVRTSYFGPSAALPLVVGPATDDVDIAEWAADNRGFLEERLRRDGALLFRGFGVDSARAFEQFAQAVCPQLFGEYGDLPREGVSEKVYGSTPYPADETILFHNESSHLHRWPLNIFFYCVEAAREGGETPLVDCRRIYAGLDPRLRERFAEKGLMYVRNFTDRLDVTWQQFYGTTDRAEVERRCRAARIEFEWKGGGELRTRQVCRAVTRHPRTGEALFFNQILLHHVDCLEPRVRESMLSLFRPEDLPRNVYYGDGSAIETSVVEEISGLYWQTAVMFPWRERDVLVVDNMLAAHARMPFVGPRKILVAMGEMISENGEAR